MYIFCAIDRVTGSLGMKWAMRGNIHGDKEQIVNTTLVAYSCSFSFYDFELNKMQGGTNRHVLCFLLPPSLQNLGIFSKGSKLIT